jgi:hypothetical protein
LIAVGIYVLYVGVLYNTISYINLGIAGIFIGLVVLSFVPSNMIDIGIYDDTIYSYNLFFENLLKNANLIKKDTYTIYIPPYENLPDGAVFISSDKNVEQYIGHFDESSPIIYSNFGVLVYPPICHNFIKKFEDYAEMELKNTDLSLALSAVSSCLKANGLIGSMDYEENGENPNNVSNVDNIDNANNVDENTSINIIKLYIENITLKSCLELDESILKIACPIVSSTVFSIALSLNKIVGIEHIEKKGDSIILTLKVLGSVEDYIW